jgi:succinate dehydrogenase hydrophobic anchor subunit
MTAARRHTLHWLAQRLAGLLLAGGLAVHLVAVGTGGGPALVARLAGDAGWQLFYAVLVGLALVHGGLAFHGLWRERRHGLGALSVQRLTGLALVLFMPLHVALAVACAVFPALAQAVFALAARPPHRWLEAVVVALVVGHALGGLRVLALEGLLWSRGQRELGWLAAALTAAMVLVILVGT